MNAIIRWSIEHSRLVVTTLVLLIVAGAIAYETIPKESDPDVDIPMIYVAMILDGISPEDAERLLVRPMEQELHTASRASRRCAPPPSRAAPTCCWSSTPASTPTQALIDVREKVDLAKAELPADDRGADGQRGQPRRSSRCWW